MWRHPQWKGLKNKSQGRKRPRPSSPFPFSWLFSFFSPTWQGLNTRQRRRAHGVRFTRRTRCGSLDTLCLNFELGRCHLRSRRPANDWWTSADCGTGYDCACCSGVVDRLSLCNKYFPPNPVFGRCSQYPQILWTGGRASVWEGQRDSGNRFESVGTEVLDETVCRIAGLRACCEGSANRLCAVVTEYLITIPFGYFLRYSVHFTPHCCSFGSCCRITSFVPSQKKEQCHQRVFMTTVMSSHGSGAVTAVSTLVPFRR